MVVINFAFMKRVQAGKALIDGPPFASGRGIVLHPRGHLLIRLKREAHVQQGILRVALTNAVQGTKPALRDFTFTFMYTHTIAAVLHDRVA